MANDPQRMHAAARTPASSAPSPHSASLRVPRSTAGAASLIDHACARFEAEQLAQAFSPLFPDHLPWQKVADATGVAKPRTKAQLSAITDAVVTYREALTVTAGALTGWLDASEEDIRVLAMSFAKLDFNGMPDLSEADVRQTLLATSAIKDFPGMAALLQQPVLPECPLAKKILWSVTILKSVVPGQTLAAKIARLSDARFWRRAIRVLLMREREHFFMRLRLVGKAAEPYVSDAQLSTRIAQLKRQAEWMKQTVLVPRYMTSSEADKELLTLKQVASTPRTRFAKLYAFVKAMDAISIEQGLATGMLTLTLEPEWHPNPSHGANSWNGGTPRDAHRSMALRWQAILRDLDRLGVGVSGLRVVEPHKDGCPHWHLWLLYRPEAETAILCTVMKYFLHKLKVRNPKKPRCSSSADVVYDSLTDLLAGNGRSPTHPKEGAQVELARIDRSISSGASYAMKYMLKTVDGGDSLNAEVGLLGDDHTAAAPSEVNSAAAAEMRAKQPLTPEQAKRRAEHVAAAKRVDAYRSLWGINAGQLFGVAKCLTAWDELRRLNQAPEHPELKHLWALARGGDKEGRISAGESIQGDAKGFIEALGGLAACGKAAKASTRVSIGRLTQVGVNAYGEEIERTKGVALFERCRVRVVVGSRVHQRSGEIKPVLAWRGVKVVLASVETRLGEWTLTSVKHAALAVQRAQARMHALLFDGTPHALGALAVRTFWSKLWEGIASRSTEPPPTSAPWQLAAR